MINRFAHMVVADGWNGLTNAEQIAGPLSSRVFECEHCSDPLTKIYHNIIGKHRHVSAGKLREEWPHDP